MALLIPLWLQNGTYPARYDRQLILEAFGGREMVLRGMLVTQNGGGDVSVNVSAGAALVLGDDQANQGLYLCCNEAVDNVSFPATPGSDKRIDLLCVTVQDPQAGGAAGDDWQYTVTSGVVSATPVAPAAPDSALAIATVLRTAGDSAILTSMITDVAGRGLWPYTVDDAAVPARLPPNYLYVKV